MPTLNLPGAKFRNFLLTGTPGSSNTITATSFTDVTSMSGTFVSAGGLVKCELVSDGDANASGLAQIVPPAGTLTVRVLRDAVDLGQIALQATFDLQNVYVWTDDPGPGSFTYKIQAKVSTGSGRVQLVKLLVTETG